MIKVMMLICTGDVPEATEVALKTFSRDSIIELISDSFSNDVMEDDLEIDESGEEYVVITVTCIHTDDGDINLMLIGKQQDFKR